MSGLKKIVSKNLADWREATKTINGGKVSGGIRSAADACTRLALKDRKSSSALLRVGPVHSVNNPCSCLSMGSTDMGTGEFGLGGRPRLPMPLVPARSFGETGRSGIATDPGDVYRDFVGVVDIH